MNILKIKNISLVIYCVLMVSLVSCEKALFETPETSNIKVFEEFWKSIDQNYTYFELKNIDWQKAYNDYRPKINDQLDKDTFFSILSQMIDILKDGHSGVVSEFDTHKYYWFFLNYKQNYNERLVLDNYFQGNIFQTGPFKHTLLKTNNIGYIGFKEFSQEVEEKDIDYLLEKYKDTKGLIIDVRDNPGGKADNIFVIAKRFTKQKVYAFKSQNKQGTDHNDFTDLKKVYVEGSSKAYTKPVCVLTNRKCYSATSFFALTMRELSNVTLVGDTTGGGLGMPVGRELTNGWQVYYSGSRAISPNDENFELGVPPDIQVDMKPEDEANGMDTILEEAIKVINGK